MVIVEIFCQSSQMVPLSLYCVLSVNTAVNVILFESHHISDSICICLFQAVACNTVTPLLDIFIFLFPL